MSFASPVSPFPAPYRQAGMLRTGMGCLIGPKFGSIFLYCDTHQNRVWLTESRPVRAHGSFKRGSGSLVLNTIGRRSTERPSISLQMQAGAAVAGWIPLSSCIRKTPGQIGSASNTTLGQTLSSFPLPTGRLVRPDTPDAPWNVRPCFLPSRASN